MRRCGGGSVSKSVSDLQYVDVEFLPPGDEVADRRVLHLVAHEDVGVLVSRPHVT